MTRDEVVAKLRETRVEFDRLLAKIPEDRLAEQIPGTVHSPKDIVYHVASYDDLMIKRFRAARDAQTTAFDRDRDSWEAFNERVWFEAAALEADAVLALASATFLKLLDEVGELSDEDLGATSVPTALTAHIDQGWLEGHAVWELIGTDGFEHYPMHYAQLEAAAAK